MTETIPAAEHFKGCHPEHAEAPYEIDSPPADPEPCWHCATSTRRGCYCPDCLDNDDDVPAEMVYHCPLCGRWWSYMYMRYIQLHFEREDKP